MNPKQMFTERISFLLIITVILTQHTAKSSDVFVDSSITQQNGSTYPTLKQAVQAIYNSATQSLLNNSNTVTLRSNTHGTTQMLPNLALNQASGGISIIFENLPSQLASMNDCAALPTLILSSTNDSILSMTGLDYFLLQGLNIQLYADSSSQQFTSMRNVTFDSFCITSSDVTGFSFTQSLSFSSISNLTLSNFNLNWTSSSKILADSCYSSVVQNSNFFTSTLSSNQILCFSNEQQLSDQNLFVDNLWATCPSSFHIPGEILNIENVVNVQMQWIQIQDCNYLDSNIEHIMSFQSVGNLTFQYFTLKNLQISLEEGWITSIIQLEDINFILLENFYIYNILSNCLSPAGGFDIVAILFTQTQTGMVMSNFTFENITIVGGQALVNMLVSDSYIAKNIYWEGFTVVNSNFTAAELLILKVPEFQTRQSITTTTPYYFSNLNVSGCYFNSSAILALLNVPSDTTGYVIDMYRVEMSGVNLQSNFFWSTGSVNVIELTGSQLRMTNMVMNNNTFLQCGFIVVTLRVSSAFFINLTVQNLYLNNSAVLLDYSLEQTTYIILEPWFYGLGTYLIEERPFMMINCTFSNITLNSQSSLILGNNPTIMLINNTFTSINSTSSSIFSIGEYLPPDPKPSGTSYATSTIVQNAIFAGAQSLEDLFQSLRNLMSTYEFSDPVAFFFVYAESNLFSNIISNNEASIFSISNLQLDSTIIGLFNNTFLNLSINAIASFNLLSFSEISQVVLQNTSFSTIKGGSYSLAISSQTLYTLQLNSTYFDSIRDIAGYSLQFSICYQVAILSDQSSNIQSSSTWIYFSCDYSEGSIAFESANYTNAIITASSQELLALYFLQIQVEEVATSSGTENVFIIGTNFNNITTDKTEQGFVQNVFKSPTILLTLSNSALSIENSQFYSLSSLPDDNIIGISAVNLTITNCTVNNLAFNEVSGAIYMVFSNLVINGSTFQSNARPDDGSGELLNLVSSDFNSLQNITIQNSIFTSNVATLIIIEGSQINFVLKDSVVANNYPQSSGSFIMTAVQNSSITFQNVSFLYSQVANDSNFAYTYDILQVSKVTSQTNVTFYNCTLEIYGSAFTGDLIVLTANQNINLNVTGLTYHQSVSTSQALSYGILRADNVNNALLNNLDVEGLSMNASSLISFTCLETSPVLGTISVTNSNFNLLSMFESSSIFYISDSSLTAQETCGLAILLSQMNFSDISSADSGPIFQISASKLRGIDDGSNIIEVSNSKFQNITASNGAIYYGENLQNNATIFFQSSVFSNIHVTDQGGIFYVEEATIGSLPGPTNRRILSQTSTNNMEYIIVTSSNFSNISAYSGGVYYSTYPNQGASNLVFTSNEFTDVSVQERGAIIYANDPTIFAVGNQFIDNSALIAGSIIYSQRATINISMFNSLNQFSSSTKGASTQLVSFSPNFLDIQIISANPIPLQSFPNSSFLLTNLTSYSLQTVQFNFVLQYTDSQISQNVVDESQSISIEMTFQSPNTQSKKYIGNCSAGSCSLSPSQIILSGEANTIIQIDAVYQSYESPFYNSSQQFFIQLRACIPGEINNTLNEICTYCDNNTFSLNPLDKSCNPCPPAGATCQGGADIVLSSGYWRNSSFSSNIVACNGSSGSRCLGGGPNNCSEGFTGPVCSQCDIGLGYVADGSLSCSKCSSKQEIISLGVVLFLALLAYQFFVLYTTYKYNKKLHADTQDDTKTTPARTGAYMVIFATYSQVSSVISKLSVGYITDLFGISSAVGNPNQQIFFSLACLYSLINTDPFSILKFKTIFFVLSPVAKVLIALPFLVIRGIYRRKVEDFKQHLKMNLGVTAIMFIILEQPSLIGVLCEYLTCTKLDPNIETEYVSVQAGVECGTTEYNSFKYTFVFPALAIWGFAIPLFLLLLLLKNKRNLNGSESLRIIFGSLYNNYTRETFYWGIVIIFFKISIFTLDSLLNLSEIGKAMVFLLVIYAYYYLFQRKRPHLFNDLQQAENYVILSFIWTLIAVLVKDVYEKALVNNFCDLIITIANVVAVGYLIYKILFVYLKKIVIIFSRAKSWWIERRTRKKRELYVREASSSDSTITAKTKF